MRPAYIYSKYFSYLARFGTAKKISNMLQNSYEQKAKRVRLKSHPYKVTIDPGNFCNLRCPGCHTGIKHSEMIKPAFMKFNDFKIIFDQVKNYTLSVALYNWGSPFSTRKYLT